MRILARPGADLDVVAGLCEGILTALALAGGKLLGSGAPVSAGFAFRVAAAVGVAEVFVFFVAHYAELRSQLIRAERQLNLTARGRLATTRLGRAVLRDAFGTAMVATVCSTFGALIPLWSAALLPGRSWVGIAVALGALALLGLALARAVHGDPRRWALALLAGGIAVTWVSIRLDIVA